MRDERPRFGNRSNSNNGPRGNFRGNSGPRKMYKATCSECGKECEVPFMPKEDRPVYCKDCYMAKKEN